MESTDIVAVNESKTFDIRPFVGTQRGKPYLEVQWRLLWLNKYVEENNLSFEVLSEMVEHNEEAQFSIFKTTVTLFKNPEDGSSYPLVVRSGTGYGREDASDFGDYIEKAETKSLGRALAKIGFGTQFAGDDLDEGDIVDAPSQKPMKVTAVKLKRKVGTP